MYTQFALGKRHRSIFADALPALRNNFVAAERIAKRARTMVPMYDVLTAKYNPPKSMVSPGDRRLRQVREMLDKFKWARSPDQVKFHEHFIKLCLPHIYGAEDFEKNRVRLMNEFKIDWFKVGSLTITPRRWGKTTSVAMFIAVLMMVCEKVTIACFSSGKRASFSLMQKVTKYITELKGGYERIVAERSECLTMSTPSMTGRNLSKRYIIGTQQVNRFFAYPATTTALCLIMTLTGFVARHPSSTATITVGWDQKGNRHSANVNIQRPKYPKYKALQRTPTPKSRARVARKTYGKKK